MVEDEVRKSSNAEKATANDPQGLDQIITDDENDDENDEVEDEVNGNTGN